MTEESEALSNNVGLALELPDDLQDYDSDRTPRVRAYDLSALQRSLNQNNERLTVMSSLVKWSKGAATAINTVQQDMALLRRSWTAVVGTPLEVEEEKEENTSHAEEPVSRQQGKQSGAKSISSQLDELTRMSELMKFYLTNEVGFDEEIVSSEVQSQSATLPFGLEPADSEASQEHVDAALASLQQQLQELSDEERLESEAAIKECQGKRLELKAAQDKLASLPDDSAERAELVEQVNVLMSQLQGQLSRAITPIANSRPPTQPSATTKLGASIKPARPGSWQAAAEASRLEAEEWKQAAEHWKALATAQTEGEARPTTGDGSVQSSSENGDTVAESTSSFSEVAQKEMEDAMARSMNQVLLTMNELVKPLDAKMARVERVIKRLHVLNLWAASTTDPSKEIQSAEASAPAADPGEKKMLSELRKTVKHMESCLTPLQTRMGKFDDYLARLQVRVLALEQHKGMKHVPSRPATAQNEIDLPDHNPSSNHPRTQSIVEEVNVAVSEKMLEHSRALVEDVLEPLQLRVDTLEAMYPSCSNRLNAVEEVVFSELDILEKRSPGSGESSEATAQTMRLEALEGLVGPLHVRMGKMEKAQEAVSDTTGVMRMRWATQDKHRNHQAAQIEKMQNDLTEISDQNMTQEERLKEINEVQAKIEGLEEKLAQAMSVDDKGATSSEYRVVNQAVESLRKQLQTAQQEWTSAQQELMSEMEAKIGMHQIDDMTTVVSGTSTAIVRGPRTHNGYAWAIGNWDRFVNQLCDSHNRAWEIVAKQMGISHTLELFRQANIGDGLIGEDEDLESSMLERKFIEHLEQALHNKADAECLDKLEEQLKGLKGTLSGLQDKLETQAGIGSDLENIEDRVGEMIRAAVPVEQDIESRLQELFANKMVNRTELEAHLEERLREMEEGLQEKLVGGTLSSNKDARFMEAKVANLERDVHSVERSSQQHRDKIHASVQGMQDSLSSKADRNELLHAIEGVEKQVPGSQDRLATALAARAHCYQTLNCLSCDQPVTPPAATGAMVKVASPVSGTRSSVGALIPKNAKRQERLVNIRALLEQQERALTTDGSTRDSLRRDPNAFLHLMPRASVTAGGSGLVTANPPHGSPTFRHVRSPMGEHMSPSVHLKGFSELIEGEDQLQDVNMSLGLHVRALPNIGHEKQWSPEVAREIRKGFNL